MAGEREPKRIDRRLAWTAKVGGYGAAVIGIFGPESWIIPGAVIGTGGLLYEKATDPDRKTKPKLEKQGTIFQKAKTIVTLGAR